MEPGIVGGKAWWVWSEECRVVEVSFGGHHRIRACRLETTVDIRVVEDVSVGKDRYRNGFLDRFDLPPVGKALWRKGKPHGKGIVDKGFTVLCPRCSLMRPWQVMICAPARSSILAYSTVFSTVGKTLNFAVTGMDRFLCNVLTIIYEEWKGMRGGSQAREGD